MELQGLLKSMCFFNSLMYGNTSWISETIISLSLFQLPHIIVFQLNHVFNYAFYLFLLFFFSEVKALVLPQSFSLKCEYSLWLVFREESKASSGEIHWNLSFYLIAVVASEILRKLQSFNLKKCNVNKYHQHRTGYGRTVRWKV